jgi:NAD(P)-dependent dehydrogenase (short-subunit alcohol dehydrogenase family)
MSTIFSRVQGKVIIVTGTNSPIGIGRAAVHQYANNGAKAIFMCDLNTSHLETHKRELNSLYPSVDIHPRKVDAGEEADVESVVNEALEKYGRLDVFFANAGISITTERITEASADKFMKNMRTNALR